MVLISSHAYLSPLCFLWCYSYQQVAEVLQVASHIQCTSAHAHAFSRMLTSLFIDASATACNLLHSCSEGALHKPLHHYVVSGITCSIASSSLISVARHLRHEHAFARTAAMKGSALQGMRHQRFRACRLVWLLNEHVWHCVPAACISHGWGVDA